MMFSKTLRSLDRPVVDGRTIHAVIRVVDRQNFHATDSYLDEHLILLREPEAALREAESADLLVLPYEVGSFDPNREPLRRMALDADNGIVPNVNPPVAFTEVL